MVLFVGTSLVRDEDDHKTLSKQQVVNKSKLLKPTSPQKMDSQV